MKYCVLLFLISLGVQSFAGEYLLDKTTPLFGNILEDQYGSIKYMTYGKAMLACPAGRRLPTIRELAKRSQALGAKGILEVSQVDKSNVPPNYYLVSVVNPDKTKDEFYFNFDGYKRPAGELAVIWFWSSSVSSATSGLAFALQVSNGAVVFDNRNLDFGAVRCVRGE